MERHQLDYSHHPFSQPRLENTFTKNPLGNVHTQIHTHTHILCLLRCVVFNHIFTHFSTLQETVTFQTLKISQAFVLALIHSLHTRHACLSTPWNLGREKKIPVDKLIISEGLREESSLWLTWWTTQKVTFGFRDWKVLSLPFKDGEGFKWCASGKRKVQTQWLFVYWLGIWYS